MGKIKVKHRNITRVFIDDCTDCFKEASLAEYEELHQKEAELLGFLTEKRVEIFLKPKPQ